MKEIEPTDFRPRVYQEPFFNAMEKKGLKRAVLNWHRRCLSANSHIIMADGSFKLLKHIKVGDRILSWNGESFEPDIVKHVWSTEVKKTKVVSSPNLSVISSQDHVFANKGSSSKTVRWNPIQDISKNRQLMQYAGSSLGDINNIQLAEFWGYMLADGYVVGYQQPKFTNTNNTILKRVEELSNYLFDITVNWRKKDNGYDLGFSNGTKGGGATPNPIKELFRQEGCDVPKSEQWLPASIWKLDRPSLLYFFAALIASDGNIYCNSHSFKPKDTQKIIPPCVEITISCGSSYNYAWDIYWLLRKIGIIPQNPYKERESNWKIKIGKQEYVKILLEKRVYGKEEQQEKALDLIKDYSKARGTFKSCYVSIFQIADGQSEELFDIETIKNHNFIANGFLVHNSGKDVAAFNFMVRQAIREVGSYYYLLPTYNQARRIIFEGMTITGKKFLDFIPKELIAGINISQMKITLKNNSIIYFLGSERYDSLRGTNAKGMVFSEYAYQHPNVYPTLRPVLVANDGWAIFVSTPFGENHFYKIFQVAQGSEEWFLQTLAVKDTGVVSDELIQKELDEGIMSADMIQQEYHCSFSVGAIGSYYSRYLNKMDLNNQLGHVAWDPSHPVHTAWDLGLRDTCVIIFYQTIGNSVYVIDLYHNNDVGLEHYIHVIKDKEYQYGVHVAPHDIRVREFSSGGVSRWEKANNLGVEFMIAPNMSIADGIETVRTTLPRIHIDNTKCKRLISAIKDYRKVFNAKTRTYDPRPLHDDNSNFCDAIRYMCLYLPQTRDSLSASELDRRYQSAVYGGNQNLPAMFRD